MDDVRPERTQRIGQRDSCCRERTVRNVEADVDKQESVIDTAWLVYR